MIDNELIRVNPFTKEIHNPVDMDYCLDERILPTVKALYNQNKSKCNNYIDYWRLPVFNPDDRRFYVYAWHTQTDPKKYFYVGKGSRSRYRHILTDIDDYITGKKKHNSRYKWYSYLQDKYGIECELVISGLSDYEAIIYEQALKCDYLNSGEVLLNVEGIPAEYRPDGWQDRRVEKPTVENSCLFRRYCDYEDTPAFDEVNTDSLKKVYFYLYGVGRDDKVSKEKALIEKWVNATSGRIYSSGSAKGVESIIVFRFLSEERYRVFKSIGKKILSSTDVINQLGLK